MKAFASKIGKAMSAALFVLLLVAVGTTNALAQTQVATLQHGEDISVFYGQNAFVDAHTAAETGDVITLSSGTFTPTDITKAITLRGAGCVIDTVTGIYPTVIPNSFQMNVTNDTAFLTVEGIYFSGAATFLTLNHPKFIKCNFNSFYNYNNNSNLQYAQLINCMMKNGGFSKASNTTFINCVIDLNGVNTSNVTITAYNSIFKISGYAEAMNAYNCIYSAYYGGLSGNSTAYNCIAIPYMGGTSLPDASFNCMYVNSFSNVFETYNGESVSFDESYNLKENIATGFLGTDGTEVGIHGGVLPYSSRPSYMVIEQCNVANRSTIDGKLSVEIEVTTQGE